MTGPEMLRGSSVALRPVRAADLDALRGRHVDVAGNDVLVYSLLRGDPRPWSE